MKRNVESGAAWRGRERERERERASAAADCRHQWKPIQTLKCGLREKGVKDGVEKWSKARVFSSGEEIVECRYSEGNKCLCGLVVRVPSYRSRDQGATRFSEK
jgi:hypothetical protein